MNNKHLTQEQWGNMILKNTPGMSDCQVVSAVNAYMYLTGKVIKQDSKKYQKLVKLAKAEYGAAISIEKVHQRLGICVRKTTDSFLEIASHGKALLPCEVYVWHKYYGFHSCLLVDYEPLTEAFRMTNFDRATSTNGWIFSEDLNHFVSHRCSADWHLRVFKLIK